ncbi:ABC transporter permease [Candidatus Dactylopiibacterium carminicum]|uniref:ABC transporter permease n=1 Tax=Candidatus Dactylopiibacterium carminicum TaxID=857335 RepID=UPI0026CE220B|nr:FtsX-like permease family protein [Candidatus Dactylopiibacterium carminicum]
MSLPGFSFRLLRRDLRAGELHLLGLALFVAVAALSSIAFLTNRVEQGIVRDAAQLLGGDLLVSADTPLPAEWIERAHGDGLRTAQVLQFRSMASTDAAAEMVALKVVEAGYPLRGVVEIAKAPGEASLPAKDVPAPGEVWLDEPLLVLLGVGIGDVVQLGYADLRVTALITNEPDRGMGFSSFMPRVMMNMADLPASRLVQEGSRVRYRLQLAGEPDVVVRFRDWVRPLLDRGQELESVDDARPEIRERLDRAARFLRLAAMLAVVLAAVAIGLAARRYLQRHLDSCAVMRCFGAGRRQLLGAYALAFTGFALVVSLLGCLAGYGVQALLTEVARSVIHSSLPSPGWLPWLQGLVLGLVLLLGFVMPQLLRLTRVAPIRVIRREWSGVEQVGVLAWGAGAVALAAVMLWVAADLRLGLAVIGGFVVALAAFALLAWAALGFFGRLRHAGGGWGLRYGLAALARRRASSTVQVVALALGLTAVLLLTVVSRDLLAGTSAAGCAESLPHRCTARPGRPGA